MRYMQISMIFFFLMAQPVEAKCFLFFCWNNYSHHHHHILHHLKHYHNNRFTHLHTTNKVIKTDPSVNKTPIQPI